jgi:hypothetical protein
VTARVLAALAAAFAVGCAPAATEALVTISNVDLNVPGDFDTIHIEVHEVSAQGALLSSADVKPCVAGEHGDGCKAFPFTVLFVPGAQVDTPAFVSVRALLGGAKVIDDGFVLAFVRGYSLRYELPLYRVCKQSHCADQGEVCNDQGLCAPFSAQNAPDLAAPALGDLAGVDLALDDAYYGAPPRRIFLTTETTYGTFGGKGGGDTICANEAQMAGLVGTFVAILGISTSSPKNYLVLDGGDRPIVRLDGKQVATDATFWEASHLAPIDVGPDGKLVPPAVTLATDAWTGFDYTGATVLNGTCEDWAPNSLNGYIGDPYGVAPASITGAWASYAAQGNCFANYPCHLYCIEQ